MKGMAVAALAAALIFAAAAAPADAQRSSGILHLDHVQPSVAAGTQVTFSGYLVTQSGHPVPGATILIKDDVDFGRDRTLMTLRTDSGGMFAGVWTAQTRGSGAWDIYAEFKGSQYVSQARSYTYSLDVSFGSNSYGGSPYNSAQSAVQPTHLTMNRLQSSVHAGDTVTFTGRLTSGGQPIQNALVTILEDDPFLPDQRLGSGRTDSGGYYRVTWSVGAGIIEDDFDVYASFDGSSKYTYARTINQTMTVLKYTGSITLDPIPSSATEGERITFSGTLYLESHGTEGAIVYIKDEDRGSGDDLLATAYVDHTGRFSASWLASPVDPDNQPDIYAVFEGNDKLYRLTTCDENPTRIFGGLCRNTVPIYVHERTAPPRPYVPDGSEHMELFYSIDFDRNPRVAIIPSPDSYNEVKSHITPVKEGVLMWTSLLGERYGGNWNVDFEVVHPGKLYWDARPDIMINLVTHDGDADCLDAFGYALISPNPTIPVDSTVCSTHSGEKRTNQDVAATAAHEFIHAMGLGHAFNKKGDLMCSVEENGPTCPGSYQKSKVPSDLNLQAVAKLYGTDGYLSPNNHVAYKSKFASGDSTTTAPSPYNPPAPPTFTPPPYVPPAYNPPAPASLCPETHDYYAFEVNDTLDPGWYTWYTLCPHGTQTFYYWFQSASQQDGFYLFVLPPETGVEDFVGGGGDYYTCEDPDQSWIRKPGTCAMEPGSKIVIENKGPNPITVTGRVASLPNQQ